MKSVISLLFLLSKGYSVPAFPTSVVTPVFTRQHSSSSNNNNQTPFSHHQGFHRDLPGNCQSKTQLQAWPAMVASSAAGAGTTAAATAVSLLRGGAETVLNLSREGYYLQTLATYGTVTALVMNASLRLYTSTKFPKIGDKTTVRYMNSLFTAVTSLCIISGAFTAVLFNILGIYTKSALGMTNDEGYLAFRAAAHIYTKWGFRSFLTTCVSFVLSFLLSLYARIKNEDDKLGQLVLGVSVVVALFAAYHIQQVLGLATKYIFTPEFLERLTK